jgi:hypothetical protein
MTYDNEPAFMTTSEMCNEIDRLREDVRRLRGLVGRMAEGLKPMAYESFDSDAHHEFVSISQADCDRAAALVAEAKKEIEG